MKINGGTGINIRGKKVPKSKRNTKWRRSNNRTKKILKF